MVADLQDPRRSEPAFVAPERVMLERWLEFHRATLLLKCDGLTAEQLARRPVGTSLLSLHGLVRHMADVERGWFTRVLLRSPEVAPVFGDPAVEDSELHPLEGAEWPADLARWQDECRRSSQNAAPLDLDHTGLRRGEPVSLRWIYVHMIEEYARHNGHADLLRELVDGATGE